MQSKAARIGLLATLAAAAVILFVVLSDDDDSGSDSKTSSTTATTESTESIVTPAAEPITFRNGEAVGGVKEIEVTKGDEVRLSVSSDVPAEVHVHGYEIEQEVEPGTPTVVDFPAKIDGKFEIELHLADDEFQVAELTVQPG